MDCSGRIPTELSIIIFIVGAGNVRRMFFHSPSLNIFSSSFFVIGDYYSPSPRKIRDPWRLSLKKISIFFDQNYDTSILFFFSFF